MEVVAKDKILMAELGERAVLVEVQPGVLLAARAAEAVMAALSIIKILLRGLEVPEALEVRLSAALAARAAEAVMVDLHTLLHPAAMEGLAVLEGIVTAVVAVEAEMGVWGEPG